MYYIGRKILIGLPWKEHWGSLKSMEWFPLDIVSGSKRYVITLSRWLGSKIQSQSPRWQWVKNFLDLWTTFQLLTLQKYSIGNASRGWLVDSQHPMFHTWLYMKLDSIWYFAILHLLKCVRIRPWPRLLLLLFHHLDILLFTILTKRNQPQTLWCFNFSWLLLHFTHESRRKDF